MACIIKIDNVCTKEYRGICFGSLNEVINDDDLVCIGEGKAQVKDSSSKEVVH